MGCKNTLPYICGFCRRTTANKSPRKTHRLHKE